MEAGAFQQVEDERASTIVAFASPAGRGERQVLRLGGPLVREIARELLGASLPAERAHFEARLRDGSGAQPARVLWMPGPRSYTGEDALELHLSGSPVLAALVLRRVLALGARVAHPGEFTRRAFARGRLDLIRAESVLALTEAENESERRAAARLFAGGLAREVAQLRDELEELRALCEASLDFDENDTGAVPSAELHQRARALEQRLAPTLAGQRARVLPQGAARVLLCGAANAGKSTLFNALVACAGSEQGLPRALESEHRGSTRDLLEARLRLADGYELVLFDAPGDLEGAAVQAADERGRTERRAPQPSVLEQRARDQVERARAACDLEVWVLDASAPEAAARASELLRDSPGKLVVWAQRDRPTSRAAPQGCVELSARTGSGVPGLLTALGARLRAAEDSGASAERGLHERHRLALERARGALGRAASLFELAGALDLAAEELRAAVGALDEIDGQSSSEALLERIFARFCLGK